MSFPSGLDISVNYNSHFKNRRISIKLGNSLQKNNVHGQTSKISRVRLRKNI
jgi:hypothetical protein